MSFNSIIFSIINVIQKIFINIFVFILQVCILLINIIKINIFIIKKLLVKTSAIIVFFIINSKPTIIYITQIIGVLSKYLFKITYLSLKVLANIANKIIAFILLLLNNTIVSIIKLIFNIFKKILLIPVTIFYFIIYYIPINALLLAYWFVNYIIQTINNVRSNNHYSSRFYLKNLQNIIIITYQKSSLYFKIVKNIVIVKYKQIIAILIKLIFLIKSITISTYKIITSFYYFISNIVIFIIITAKVTYLILLQISSKNFWYTFANNIKYLYISIPNFSRNMLAKIKVESKIAYKYTKEILKELVLLSYFDIFKIPKLFNIAKNYKFTFIVSVVMVLFVIQYSIFLFGNTNNYKQLNNKVGNYIGIITPSTILYNVLESDFFKPIRVYKLAINLENGNLKETLEQENINTENINEIMSVLKDTNLPSNIPRNWIINLVLQYSKISKQTTIQKISLPISTAYDINITEYNNKYIVEQKEKQLSRYVTKRKVQINQDFYSSLINSDIPSYIANETLRLVSWDLDLQRDLRVNDSLDLIYECLYNQNDELVLCDNILFLSFKGRKTSFIQYYYNNQYYHSDGSSVAKILMLTPVKNTRISSNYGGRVHPILGYNIVHKGVDFAGPIGTPIYASGKGKIVKIEYLYGYGNYIKIQHTSSLSTAYAHQSRFASGLKVGDTVEQWQLIGYIGNTGNVTGPHLHYEVLVNNKQVNPLSIKTPSQYKLAGRDLRKFYIYKTTLDGYILRIPNNIKTSNSFNPPNTENIF